jgi:hypothetical protein
MSLRRLGLGSESDREPDEGAGEEEEECGQAGWIADLGVCSVWEGEGEEYDARSASRSSRSSSGRPWGVTEGGRELRKSGIVEGSEAMMMYLC